MPRGSCGRDGRCRRRRRCRQLQWARDHPSTCASAATTSAAAATAATRQSGDSREELLRTAAQRGRRPARLPSGGEMRGERAGESRTPLHFRTDSGTRNPLTGVVAAVIAPMESMSSASSRARRPRTWRERSVARTQTRSRAASEETDAAGKSRAQPESSGCSSSWRLSSTDDGALLLAPAADEVAEEAPALRGAAGVASSGVARGGGAATDGATSSSPAPASEVRVPMSGR